MIWNRPARKDSKNMKLLIDANILLDVLQDRAPYASESSLIWKLCEAGICQGCVSALSFANLVCVMRKELDPQKTEHVLAQLLQIFSITDLRQADLEKAAALHWADYEDAVQSVSAGRIKAAYIVTRNTRDFANSSVPAISPAGLLKKEQLI